MSAEMKMFSDNLAASLAKLFQIGGLALVFIFIGILAMLAGHMFEGTLSGWIFGIGAILTVACLGLFVYSQVSGPVQARRVLRENQAALDAIQELALELTRTAGVVQSYLFKHMKEIDRVLDSAIPILSTLPFLQEKLDTWGLSEARNTSKLIVDFTSEAEEIISGAERALIEGDIRDIRKLSRYSQDLHNVTLSLRDALKERRIEATKDPGHEARQT